MVTQPSASSTAAVATGSSSVPRGEIADVAAQHRRRPQPDPSHLAGGDGSAVVVDHLELDAGHGPTDGRGHHVVGVLGPGTGSERRLGRGVAHHDGAPQASPHGVDQLGWDTRRAGARDSQMGEVGTGEVGVGEHQGPLGGHTLPDRDPLRAQQVDGRYGGPRLGRDHRGDAVGDLVPGAGHVADMGKRQRRQPSVTGTGQHVRACRHGLQVGVVEHRPLGYARGPTGPHDGDGVAGVEGGPSRSRVLPRAGQGVALEHRAAPGRKGARRHGVGVDDGQRGPHPGRDRGLLGAAHAKVHAGRDRPDAAPRPGSTRRSRWTRARAGRPRHPGSPPGRATSPPRRRQRRPKPRTSGASGRRRRAAPTPAHRARPSRHTPRPRRSSRRQPEGRR